MRAFGRRCVLLVALVFCCGNAAAQSLGDFAGRIGGAYLNIGMASLLEITRAPDGSFRKAADDHPGALAESLLKLLPPGADLPAAASGFRTLGEFVTALRASNNLSIPFADLKSKIVAGSEISDAIEALRPQIDGLIEARRARFMARADLKR